MPTGPVALLGDKLVGLCAGHQIPGPPSGNPIPAPAPLPFSATITNGCSTKTLIMNKPVVLVGASGLNTPPHVGLHASDPFMTPPTQLGMVTMGSGTVLIENKPVARMGDTGQNCFKLPVCKVVATGTKVIVGG